MTANSQPIGDKMGNAYWNENCELGVYKEDFDKETWTLVVKYVRKSLLTSEIWFFGFLATVTVQKMKNYCYTYSLHGCNTLSFMFTILTSAAHLLFAICPYWRHF